MMNTKQNKITLIEVDNNHTYIVSNGREVAYVQDLGQTVEILGINDEVNEEEAKAAINEAIHIIEAGRKPKITKQNT